LDQLGKKVFIQNLTSKRTLIAPQIPVGVYYVSIINSSGNNEWIKFIKQ